MAAVGCILEIDLDAAQGTCPDSRAAVVVKDRRRPRRSDQVSPHLISLLRNPAADTLTLPASDVDTPLSGDDLRPARGIIVGSLLSLPLWASIAALVRAVLH